MSASYCFDLWKYFMKQEGLQSRYECHDENLFYSSEKQKEEHTRIIRNAMTKLNDTLKLNVTLDCSVDYGPNYAEVH